MRRDPWRPARLLAAVMLAASIACSGGGGSGTGSTAETGSGDGDGDGHNQRAIDLLSLDGVRGCLSLANPIEVRCWPTDANQIDVGQTSVVEALPLPIDQLSGEDGHTCALANGEVWCWGSNSDYQLGNDGETTEVAQLVAGLPTPITEVSAGQNRTCVVAADEVWCWGEHYPFGSPSATPTKVEGLPTPIASVATGALHTCALASGTVYCWGGNSNGQLGDGTTDNRAEPAPVVGLPTNVTQIAAGGVHSCALADGSVYCWGSREYGQLGPGAIGRNGSISVTEPYQVPELGGPATVILAEAEGTCALVEQRWMCWGRAETNQEQPTEVTLAAGFTAFAIAGFGGCAAVAGEVLCWGSNKPPNLDPPDDSETGETGGTDDPYGPCSEASDCPIPDSRCPGSTGTCQPPCDGGACPNPINPGGAAPTCSADTCIIPCDLDTPCPEGMTCQAAILCVWG